MKKLFIFWLIVFNITLQAQNVRIAAAGNLRYILEEIKTNYIEVNPGINIIVTLGSSGALFQQIINGAEFDIYMAADKIYPDKLKAEGIVSGDVKTYAFGKLVLWSNCIDVSKGLDVLTDKSVNRIAIAKPDVAPYGNRTVACLKYYNLFDKVKDKIVYADNIAQAAQFAQTGNAEVGFLAFALVAAPEMKGSYYMPDEKSYKPVEQAMVLLKSWQTNPEAAKFMKFILSDTCKPVFEKYGFMVPRKETVTTRIKK